mgnify:FL=1
MRTLLTIVLLFGVLPVYSQQNMPLKEEEKEMVISKMKAFEEVEQALVIDQKEIEKVSLALIVTSDTSKDRAKELGKHFLRNAMMHIADENKPVKKVGKSKYNYMISVCTDRDVIVMGTKTPDEASITW